jgi:hypothetical protein
MLISAMSSKSTLSRLRRGVRRHAQVAALSGAAVLLASAIAGAADRLSPSGLTGTQILEKSAAAEGKRNWRGRQTIEVKVGEGTITYVLDIVHKAPDIEYRWYKSPASVKEHRVKETASEAVQYIPTDPPRLVRIKRSQSSADIQRDMLSLMRRNYVIQFQRMGRIAGRLTYVVNASPRWPGNGDPSQTRYIDRDTFVNLATEQFPPDVRDPGLLTDEQRRAKRLSVERFESVEFPASIRDDEIEMPSGGDIVEIKAPDVMPVGGIGEFAKYLDKFVPRTPMALPPGYAMEQAAAMPQHPMGKGGQVFFTNGVGIVILGFVRPDTNEHRVTVEKAGDQAEGVIKPYIGSLRSTGKYIDNTLYTLVANLDDDSIQRLADSIDPVEEGRIIIRISTLTGIPQQDIIRLRQEGLGMQQTHLIMRISCDSGQPLDQVFRSYQQAHDMSQLFAQYHMDMQKLLEEQRRLLGEHMLFLFETDKNESR